MPKIAPTKGTWRFDLPFRVEDELFFVGNITVSPSDYMRDCHLEGDSIAFDEDCEWEMTDEVRVLYNGEDITSAIDPSDIYWWVNENTEEMSSLDYQYFQGGE